MKLSNKIKKSFSLKENNLLKIDSTAKFFIEIFDLEDLINICLLYTSDAADD